MAAVNFQIAVDRMQINGDVVGVEYPQLNQENAFQGLNILNLDIGQGDFGIFLQS